MRQSKRFKSYTCTTIHRKVLKNEAKKDQRGRSKNCTKIKRKEDWGNWWQMYSMHPAAGRLELHWSCHNIKRCHNMAAEPVQHCLAQMTALLTWHHMIMARQSVWLTSTLLLSAYMLNIFRGSFFTNVDLIAADHHYLDNANNNDDDDDSGYVVWCLWLLWQSDSFSNMLSTFPVLSYCNMLT